MKQGTTRTALVLTLLGATIATSALAQPPANDEWSLVGGFQLGIRSVDVDGRTEKYQEDINLEEGPRLFDFHLDLAPPLGLRRHFDHLELSLTNQGGDPFAGARFEIEKYGRYSLAWEQRKAAYFYEDLILPPELASPEVSTAGDLHHFDFERIRDEASFKVWLGRSARLELGFDRFTKKGRSTTTLDIERDEFELERPIDESLNEYHVGLSYDWKRATLVLVERVRKYDNSIEAFLPGASPGVTPDDPTVLDFFVLDQPYDLSSYGHSAVLVVRPTDRLMIELDASREDLDLALRVAETSEGIGFTGAPYNTDSAGSGRVDRDLKMLDFSVAYQIADRLAVLLEAGGKSLDQAGELALGEEPSRAAAQLDGRDVEVALQVDAMAGVTLTAGVRTESRELTTDDETELEKTEHDGYFAFLSWRPDRRLSISTRFDVSSFDNPFAVASASDRESLSIRFRYSRPLGLSFAGTYRLDDIDNRQTGWSAEIENLSLRAGYRFGTLDVSVGYSAMAIDRDIAQTVTTLPGFLGGLELLFPIAYRADTEVVDGRFSWAVSPRLKLGGSLRRYDNDGSFALEREQARIYSEVGFGRGYVAHLGLRRVEYDEARADFDDYRAEIAEVSIGYRWR